LLPLRQFFLAAAIFPARWRTPVDYLIGDNAYFDRIAIKRISMRFFSPYSLFQTRRLR
jgi:hypothetical protein